jgi:hypothetical protein
LSHAPPTTVCPPPKTLPLAVSVFCSGSPQWGTNVILLRKYRALLRERQHGVQRPAGEQHDGARNPDQQQTSVLTQSALPRRHVNVHVASYDHFANDHTSADDDSVVVRIWRARVLVPAYHVGVNIIVGVGRT